MSSHQCHPNGGGLPKDGLLRARKANSKGRLSPARAGKPWAQGCLCSTCLHDFVHCDQVERLGVPHGCDRAGHMLGCISALVL